jgi:hypothetical protein
VASKSKALVRVSSATEETGAVPVPVVTQAKEGGRPFIAAARRDLSEREAASPAGVRWLAYDVERLDRECLETRQELQELRRRNDALTSELSDKKVELERERSKSSTSAQNDILTYLCATAGSVGLGACASFWTVPEAAALAQIGMVVSALVVLGGIVLRVWK